MIKNKTSNDLTLENIRQVIKEEVTTVVKEQLKPINFRLGGLEEKLDEARKEWEERFNKMTNGIDQIIGLGKAHTENHASNELAHQRFNDRLSKLESAGGYHFISP